MQTRVKVALPDLLILGGAQLQQHLEMSTTPYQNIVRVT